MNKEITAKEFTETIQMSVKEYNLIQTALWTLHKEVNKEMSKSNSQKDINELNVYAQEIIELKHDLKDTFDIKQDLTF
jgi:hypothetical protein